jgi:activating signal cointegrator complex subunit 1
MISRRSLAQSTLLHRKMPPKAPPPRLTHFLCIPLVTPHSRPQLQSSLNTFRKDVADPARTLSDLYDVIPEEAIRPVGTLHLTLGVMSLPSHERVDSAVKLLMSLDLRKLLAYQSSGSVDERKGKEAEVRSKDLRLTLRGLTAMHKPSETSILYAPPVDEDQRLNSFCQKVWNVFKEAGFLVPESRPLLLHATIVNTIYVPGTKARGGHGRNRDHLETYKDFRWMSDVKLEKVAICRMGEKKLENGEVEYTVEGEVKLP